jgi:hypothetical protein
MRVRAGAGSLRANTQQTLGLPCLTALSIWHYQQRATGHNYGLLATRPCSPY